MELILAGLHLSWMGGATTYLLTLASALQRLGHEPTLYSPDAGGTAGLARARGLRIVTDASLLPARCDGVIVQDTVMALELAERYRRPQVFVSHGAADDLTLPPQLGGLSLALVAMNERVVAQARALAVDVPIVQLHQPIDIERFRLRGPVRERPAVALLLGNYLRGERRALITSVLEEHGIAWSQLGRDGGQVATNPADALARADMVVSYGRSVLEAMACGRPAYVFDHCGVDGWVTADSYSVLERDGFTGMAFDRQLDRARIDADIAEYSPAMGLVNYNLASAHHSARDHAIALATIFKRDGGYLPPRFDSARELARVARNQWHADWRAQELARDLAAAQARALAAEREAAASRTRLDEVARSRRWRAVQRLLRPLDSLRARRG